MLSGSYATFSACGLNMVRYFQVEVVMDSFVFAINAFVSTASTRSAAVYT
jgi:hypothetical protein